MLPARERQNEAAYPSPETHPGGLSTKIQRPYDTELYKERNLIERLLNKLEQFRLTATRYDKLLTNFLGFVKGAAIAISLK